jgi:hypothetical protein
VILLVILGLLSLFMMVVVSFVMTTSSQRRGASMAARTEQQGEIFPDSLIKNALYQVARGSRNPHSVVGPHSLLEDIYGEREAIAGAISTVTPNISSAGGTALSRVTYSGYADAVTTNLSSMACYQIIELGGVSFGLDRQPGFANVDDGGTPSAASIQLVAGTEFPSNIAGVADDVGETLATGSDDRPLDQYQPADLLYTGVAAPIAVFPARTEGYFAGRVITMLSGNAAGQSTHIIRWYNANPAAASTPSTTPNPGTKNNHDWRMWIRPFPNGTLPALGDKFLINGRPFNGTGFGYAGTAIATNVTVPVNGFIPYLNTVSLNKTDPSGIAVANTPAPLALMPNPANPYYQGYLKDRPSFGKMNGSQYADTFNLEGPDADEDYDAPDFQNMMLAGFVANPTNFLWEVRFPSLHRPDLIRYWTYKSTGKQQWAATDWWNLDKHLRRRVSLRPDPADNYTPVNPFSGTWVPGQPEWSGNTNFDPVNGPWDVDNDNDGAPDSVWVDLGMPVQTGPDGRMVKPLFAILCVDLDGRLNLNAHGNSGHYSVHTATTVGGTYGYGIAVPLTNNIAGHALSASMLATPTGGSTIPPPDNVYVRNMGSATGSSAPATYYAEPLNTFFDPTSINAPRVAYAFPGSVFGGATPHPHVDRNNRLNRNLNPSTVSGTVATSTCVGMGVGSGFSVADINLAPIFAEPQTLTSRSRYYRGNAYRFLLEGKWDGNYRSSASSPYAPMGIQRPAIPGRYGEPHAIDATGSATSCFQTPGYYHPPRAGLTAGTSTITGLLIGDDNTPPAPTALLLNTTTAIGTLNVSSSAPGLAAPVTFSTSFDQRVARGNAMMYTTTSKSGLFGSPADVNGRLAVGIDPRGTPIYGNQAPQPLVPGSAGLPPEAVDDPWELDLSRDAARGTIVTRAGMLGGYPSPSAGVTLTSQIDTPLTPGELSHILRPRDFDTTQSNDRSDQIVFNELRSDYSNVVHRVTTESWDVPMPNLEPTPEIRDALAAQVAVGGMGIPATNLCFGDLLRGKMMAAVRAALVTQSLSPTQIPSTYSQLINSYVPAMLDSRNVMTVTIASPTGGTIQRASRMISPDLLLGLRMNLNRPLGNGYDDDGNGVVDDPTEALKGQNSLWKQSALDGGGGGVNFDATWDGKMIVNNMNHPMCEMYGRQELAKHLYVLAMMLMDSNYTMPTAEPLRPLTINGRSVSVDEQRRILTAYRVAQWAINAVDFADRDAIMTPFEFDIYPFALGNPYTTSFSATLTIPYPGGWDVDGVVGTLSGTTTSDDSTSFRGLVWGMENPELLLTETLAFHDKGIADTDQETYPKPVPPKTISDATHRALTDKYTRGKPGTTGIPSPFSDFDFDQVRLPQGSLFVELYCTGRPGAIPTSLNPTPSTYDGALNYLPRELYNTTTMLTGMNANPPTVTNNGSLGALDLGRIAGNPANPPAKGSPVWRLAISKSHIGQDTTTMSPLGPAVSSISATTASALLPTPMRNVTIREMLTDPSSPFPGVYHPDSTTLQTGAGQFNILDPNISVIPERYVFFAPAASISSANDAGVIGNAVSFTPLFTASYMGQSTTLLPPGGYAVVGPARDPIPGTGIPGTNTTSSNTPGIAGLVNTTFVGFTDSLARAMGASAVGTAAANWHPQIISMDPRAGTLSISMTGLNVATTSSTLLYPLAGAVTTVSTPLVNNAVANIKPPVMIPVGKTITLSALNPAWSVSTSMAGGGAATMIQGLNISEPLNGYSAPTLAAGVPGWQVNTYQVTTSMSINGINTITPSGPIVSGGTNVTTGSLPDAPFDSMNGPNGSNSPLAADGIMQPGTILDYKTVFLQRLADPTFPYNPLPNDPNYNSASVSNPYLTVDWMPIDLTVFNGQTAYQPSAGFLPASTNSISSSLTNSTAQVAESMTPVSTNSAWTTPTSSSGWVPPSTSSWSGWAFPPQNPGTTRNYIRHVDTSVTSGSHLLCLESRERGFRVAEFGQGATATPAPGYPTLSGPLAMLDPWTGAGSAPIAASVGIWPPLTVTNSGTYHVTTEPVPEAPLWAAVSDHPRVTIVEAPYATASMAGTFKHQVRHHTLGYLNETYGRTRYQPSGTLGRGSWANIPSMSASFNNSTTATLSDPFVYNDYIGSPQRPFPWLTWHNRPYANAMELMLVPASSPGKFTTEFSYQTNPEIRDRWTGNVLGDANPASFTGTYVPGTLDGSLYSWGRGLFWGTVTPRPDPAAPSASLSSVLTLTQGIAGAYTPAFGLLPHLPWPVPSPQSYSAALLAASSTANTISSSIAGTLNVTAASTPSSPVVPFGRFPYGHLMNFFASSISTGSYAGFPSVSGSAAMLGPSSNLHRIFEFVEVPSRFSGTSALLTGPAVLTPAGVVNPAASVTPSPTTTPVSSITGLQVSYVESAGAGAGVLYPNHSQVPTVCSPMVPFVAPFNVVSRYREPGKVNLNTLVDQLGTLGGTVTGQPDDPQMWQAITNDFPEPFNSPESAANSPTVTSTGGIAGRLGQSYRDLFSSRANWNPALSANMSVAGLPPRTLSDFQQYMVSNSTMFNPAVPSFFRPFRSFAGNMGVPDPAMVSSLFMSDSNVLRRWNPTTTALLPPSEPLFAVNGPPFSWLNMCNCPARDPFFRYQLLTKTGGFFTTRSNVYAVWVTVGFFEVQRIPSAQVGSSQFCGDSTYPNRDGYQLVREYGSDSGIMQRYRGFAMIDRTIPVAFQRGENYNVDKCFLVRRMLY